MTPADRTDLIRRYADGAISWRELREQGFDDYIQVLGALGELGLRPPIAALAGPNLEARQRGREIIRNALKAQL